MAYRARKNMAGKVNTVVISEEKHEQNVLAAVDYGFLTVGKGKDITEKQYKHLKATGGSVAVRNQAVVAVMDGTGRTGKPVGVFSSGIAGSPMRAVCDASRQERNLAYVIDTMLVMADAENLKHVHGYFLTITIPNVDADELVTAFRAMGANGSRFVRGLSDATRRNNGMVLTGRHGEAVHVRGSLLKLENTVNKNCLKHHIMKKICHPHMHLLLITDGPLNIPVTADALFRDWQKRNPDMKLSRDAFRLEPVYAHGQTELGTPKAKLRSAGVEAMKYTTKPDYLSHFPKHATKLTAYLTAQILKATKHVHVLRARGLVALAQGYLALMRKQKPLYQASMAASYDSDNQNIEEVRVPDIYTKLGVMRGGRMLSERDLSDKELLGANRCLLEGAILGSYKRLAWPDTKRGRLFKYVFEHTSYMTTRQALENKLDLWADARAYQYNQAFLAYQDAQDNGDKELINKTKQELAQIGTQIGDLQRLRAALPLDLSKIKYTDLHRLGKLQAMFEKMKQLGCRIVWDADKNTPRPIFDKVEDDKDDVEKVLCEMYLNTDLQTFRYFTPEICAAYRTWLDTGKLYADQSDEREYSAIADVNWWQVQDAVANLAGKDNKATFLRLLEPDPEPAKTEPVDVDDIFAMPVAAM